MFLLQCLFSFEFFFQLFQLVLHLVVNVTILIGDLSQFLELCRKIDVLVF